MAFYAESFIVSVGSYMSFPANSLSKSTAHGSVPPRRIILSIYAFCWAIYSSIIYYYILIEYYVIMTVTPSINVSITPPIHALLNAAYGPLLNANIPPVRNPENIALNGSSCYLYHKRRQSIELKHPPHIAKEPPINGALFLT